MKKDSDQKDWENFLKNPSDIFDKDHQTKKSDKQFTRYKFDFHGYSIEDANKNHVKKISLGERTLRAETAPIVAISLIHRISGEF